MAALFFKSLMACLACFAGFRVKVRGEHLRLGDSGDDDGPFGPRRKESRYSPIVESRYDLLFSFVVDRPPPHEDLSEVGPEKKEERKKHAAVGGFGKVKQGLFLEEWGK
jgi:hypothetical protein